jgi:hypothetical protein
MISSFSQPFTGVGVTYARHEEAKAERQHENVQHGMFLCNMDGGAETTALAFDGSAIGRIGFRDGRNRDVIGIS